MKFIQADDDFYSFESSRIHDNLPSNVYTIKKSINGTYLSRIPDMTINHKVYGNTNQRADRILNTFGERNSNTGVMLSGEKGSGKTLLSKVIAKKAQDAGMPIITLTQPFDGEDLNSVLRAIHQPHIFFIDEFEKMYDTHDKQAPLLSILDGIVVTPRLTVVTLNETLKLNQYVLNRPGRFFYHYKFASLEEEFIVEYAEDNLKQSLKDQNQIDEIVRVSSLFDNFSFDILKALVEEMNRYDENAKSSIRHLNAQPKFSSSRFRIVNLKTSNKDYKDPSSSEYVDADPLTNFGFYITVFDKITKEKENIWTEVRPEDMISYNYDKIIFKTSKFEFELNRMPYNQLDMYNLI